MHTRKQKKTLTMQIKSLYYRNVITTSDKPKPIFMKQFYNFTRAIIPICSLCNGKEEVLKHFRLYKNSNNYIEHESAPCFIIDLIFHHSVYIIFLLLHEVIT